MSHSIILITDCSNDNDILRIEAACTYVRHQAGLPPVPLKVIADVEPYAILDGAFHVLDQARTWHWQRPAYVCVVDPGVGTARRAVAIETAAGVFIGPDNGVSTLLRQHYPALAAVELDPKIREIVPKNFAAPTFDGERLFGPAAALWTMSSSLAALGSPIDPATLINLEVPAGTVVHVDKDFRNLKVCGLEPNFASAGDEIVFRTHDRGPFIAKKGRTLSDGAGADFVVYRGSSDMLEFAVDRGFAADVLKLGVGDRITVEQA